MEATGVLPFVRGVDLSGNDFKVSGRVASRAALQAVSLLGPAPASASCPARPGPVPPG